MPKPLAIIPVYVAEDRDYPVLETTVRTLRGTTINSVDILLVDDGSPHEQAPDRLAAIATHWGAELHLKGENTGFSKTVNVGLQRALEDGRHAILVNADIEFRHPGWVETMAHQPNLLHPEGYAWVVGALLSYPNRLIQHAGVYFSLLTRSFDHLWKYAPENLPAAQEPRICPVTGALQWIRHECLEEIGLYDPEFSMAFEDVDYCLRVLVANHECVYTPAIKAFHHESIFRGRGSEKVNEWTRESLFRLMEKWRSQSFAGLVPSW